MEVIKKSVSVYITVVSVGTPLSSCAQYGTLRLLLRCLVYKVVLPELQNIRGSIIKRIYFKMLFTVYSA